MHVRHDSLLHTPPHLKARLLCRHDSHVRHGSHLCHDDSYPQHDSHVTHDSLLHTPPHLKARLLCRHDSQWLFFQNVIQVQPHGGKTPIVLYQEMWLQVFRHVSLQWGFHHHVAALESRSGKIATHTSDMAHTYVCSRCTCLL